MLDRRNFFPLFKMMKFSISCRIVAAAFAFGAFARAADAPAAGPVVLARKGLAPAGTVVTRQFATEMPAATMAKKGGGPELARISQGGTETQVCTIVGPDRLRVVITSSGGHFSMQKLPGGEPMEEKLPADPLTDLAVAFERKDGGRWVPGLEGDGKFSGEQQAMVGKLNVAENLESGEALYGLAARSAGDHWTVDLSRITEYAGLLHPKGTLTAELVKLTEVSGAPCAEIRFVYDLEGGDGASPEGTESVKGEAIVHRSLQDLLDLDERHDGVTRMTDGEFEIEGGSHSETHTVIQRP
jgi:hypothetical protein